MTSTRSDDDDTSSDASNSSSDDNSSSDRSRLVLALALWDHLDPLASTQVLVRPSLQAGWQHSSPSSDLATSRGGRRAAKCLPRHLENLDRLERETSNETLASHIRAVYEELEAKRQPMKAEPASSMDMFPTRAGDTISVGST